VDVRFEDDVEPFGAGRLQRYQFDDQHESCACDDQHGLEPHVYGPPEEPPGGEDQGEGHRQHRDAEGGREAKNADTEEEEKRRAGVLRREVAREVDGDPGEEHPVDDDERPGRCPWGPVVDRHAGAAEHGCRPERKRPEDREGSHDHHGPDAEPEPPDLLDGR